MEGIRRTIPRSARRPRRETPSPLTTHPKLQDVVPERYAPSFQPKAEPQRLPPIRTGVEVLSPPTTQPYVAFASAPLSAVRWLPHAGRTALAVVGSGCGGGAEDFLTVYGVFAERGMIQGRLEREISHEGRVTKLATGERMLYVGSSDGGVRMLKTTEWLKGELREGGRLTNRGREEAVAGLAPLGRKVCAFGEDGSIGVVDVEKGIEEAWVMCDAVGFVDAEAVDPEAGYLVVGAGGSGEIGVWDLRQGSEVVQRLGHEDDVPSCVTVDAAQGNFVIGGVRNGEVCVWDRRMGGSPLSRARIHDGMVWEVRVVASSKPGLLLSGGEDGRVWLMDYAAAACRGGGGEIGEFWRATMTQSDLRNVGGDGGVGVNGVDGHATADLYAYTTDSGSVSFGSLYS